MEEMTHIHLDETIYSSSIFWTILVETIYKSYPILYVIYKNKNYINGQTLSYHGNNLRTRLENEGIKFAHKNHFYEEYLYDEYIYGIKSNEIKYIFEGKFKFNELIFDEYFDYDYECEDEDYNNKYNILKSSAKDILLLIEETNKKISIYNIKFVLDKCINLQNIGGIYDECNRGSDNMVISLPFETNIKLQKEFTLEEMITALYNLKTHKFDYWYELFSGATVKVSNTEIDLDIILGHGS